MHQEDILHALRDCPQATLVRRKLVPFNRRVNFFWHGLEGMVRWEYLVQEQVCGGGELVSYFCNDLLVHMEMKE